MVSKEKEDNSNEEKEIQVALSRLKWYISDRLDYLQSLDMIKRRLVYITDKQNDRFERYHSIMSDKINEVKTKEDLLKIFTYIADDDYEPPTYFEHIEIGIFEGDCVNLGHIIDELIYIMVEKRYHYQYSLIRDESARKYIHKIKRDIKDM